MALGAAIIVPFLFFGDELESLSGQWLAAGDRSTAVSWIAFSLLVADVLLPVPSSLVITSLSFIVGPVAAWTVSFLGLSAGAALGYGVGRALGPAAVRALVGEHEGRRLDAWMTRHGCWVIAACRAVPVLAEASLIVAGAARLSVARSLSTAAAASALVPLPYVALGSAASTNTMFIVAFGLSIALSGVLWLLGRRSTA